MEQGNVQCRLCSAPLERAFVSFGLAPLSNAYLTPEELGQAEVFFRLTSTSLRGLSAIPLMKATVIGLQRNQPSALSGIRSVTGHCPRLVDC